jgi:HAD superfamily hydrolase (TIGR01549 family)|tara:strand:- start:1160 stop:1795 length:636 start_codon:yes stop_codon:yes gene_type:complete
MKYKAIIFDLDFTLYNECDFLKEVVISSSVFDNPENGINKITYRFRIDSYNIVDDLLNIEDLLTKENNDYLFHIMKEINVELSCYDGIIEMLEELKENSSINTGVVTNGVPEIQKNKMQCLGIEEYFNQTIYAKELGSEKPNYLPFEEALDRLEVEPESALYVGDHPLNDIKPANELGMDTLWIDHLNNDDIVSTYRITDANNLADTIAIL